MKNMAVILILVLALGCDQKKVAQSDKQQEIAQIETSIQEIERKRLSLKVKILKIWEDTGVSSIEELKQIPNIQVLSKELYQVDVQLESLRKKLEDLQSPTEEEAVAQLQLQEEKPDVLVSLEAEESLQQSIQELNILQQRIDKEIQEDYEKKSLKDYQSLLSESETCQQVRQQLVIERQKAEKVRQQLIIERQKAEKVRQQLLQKAQLERQAQLQRQRVMNTMQSRAKTRIYNRTKTRIECYVNINNGGFLKYSIHPDSYLEISADRVELSFSEINNSFLATGHNYTLCQVGREIRLLKE